VNAGDKLTEENLVPINIPKGNVGNLNDFAYLWEASSSVVGRPVCRTLTGGSLLLKDDLKTPPPNLTLQPDERLVWVPVASSSFVPSLVSPGNEVEFAISYEGPTPAYMAPSSSSSDSAAEEGSASPQPKPVSSLAVRSGKGDPQILGPFKILSLGNRLSSPEVWQAWGKQPANENVIGVVVRVQPDGQLEPKGKALVNLLHQTGFRNVLVMLCPSKKKEAGKAP
jgi:hypothetical protein